MTESTNVVDTPVAQEAFLADVPTHADTLTTPVSTTPTQSTRTFTEEDIRKARETEKNKVYETIGSLKDEVATLKKEREERLAEVERARQAAEDEARKKAESEMDLRQLLESKEKEWADKLEQERTAREQSLTLLNKERQYAELQEYRSARVSQERENILPELVDLIAGNTPDEIESSIAGLKERTSSILANTQQSLQSARREMKGTSLTAPASGPLDTNSDQQQFTAENIAAMSVTEYAKYRSRLLPNVNNGNKGIFG